MFEQISIYRVYNCENKSLPLVVMSFDLIAAPDGGQEMTNGKWRKIRDSDTFNDPPEKTKFWEWVRDDFEPPNEHFESWIRGTKKFSRERVKRFFEDIQNRNRRLKSMPYDVHNEILRNTETCQERSDYCEAIAEPLKNTQSIDGQTPCTNRMFKELHDAKCKAQNNRIAPSRPYPKIMNVLLDHLQASVDGDVKKLRDAELKHLLDSLLTHEHTDDKGKKFFSRRNLGLKPADARESDDEQKKESDEIKKIQDDENKWNIILSESAKFGHANVVEVLLAAGCDPRFSSNSAVRFASENGHLAVVEVLLAWKGEENPFDWEPMVSNEQLIRVDPTAKRNYAIIAASRNGRLEVVKALLAWEGPNGERVNPTVMGNSAVRFASENGHLAVVKALLAWEGPNDKRVNPTAHDNYAVRFASENGHLAVVQALLAWKRPHRAATRAYQMSFINILQQLYDSDDTKSEDPNGRRVDPTAEDNYAVRKASQNGHSAVVEALLAWEGDGDLEGLKVDPTVKDNEAVLFASEYGRLEVVNALLAWKGDGDPEGLKVDPTDGRNYAVREASRNGYSDVVEALLAWKGPDDKRVDPTYNYNAAVLFASRNGHLAVVKVLLGWEGLNGKRVVL